MKRFTRPGMLASVTSSAEARLALDWGADIVDLKDPSAGVLGALPESVAREVVTLVGGRCPVSATVGDLVVAPPRVVAAVEAMAATGVDYVKVGFFSGQDARACAAALAGPARSGIAVVAVLFADGAVEDRLLDDLAEHGFAGVMLDTAAKDGRSLRDHWNHEAIARFVAAAAARGMMSGLAGSLREADVAPLAALRPDYLGFRGALCAENERVAHLSRVAFARIRAALSLWRNS